MDKIFPALDEAMEGLPFPDSSPRAHPIFYFLTFGTRHQKSREATKGEDALGGQHLCFPQFHRAHLKPGWRRCHGKPQGNNWDLRTAWPFPTVQFRHLRKI